MRGITILMLFTVLPGGCSQDPIQQDLLEYSNRHIPPAAAKELDVQSSRKALNAALLKAPPDIPGLVKVLDEQVLPRHREFLALARGVVPRTEQLRLIHTELVDSVSQRVDALSVFRDAVAANVNDLAAVRQARDRLAAPLKASDEAVRKYVAAIQALAKRHDVSLEPDR